MRIHARPNMNPGVQLTKIYIRFGAPEDIERLITEGILANTPEVRTRCELWLSEQRAGRRVVLIAEDKTGMLGVLQLVFKLPTGYSDPESANGRDIAMMDTMRLKPGAPAGISNELLHQAQVLAHKRNIKTLTFCLPMTDNRALSQVKAWGFEEYRIMPEKTKMLAFFRKAVD